MIYQRPNNQQRKPVRRLQSGVAGSLLAVVDPPKPQRTVLLHFCFDQQNGEIKQESCPCKQRVPFDEAAGFVQQGCADWLLIKNPKTAKLVKFRRAVAVRRAVIGGEVLFAVHNNDVKINRRDKKHEQIKATIRADARTILEKLFSRGLVPQFVVKMNDAQLEDFLSHDKECEDFLTTLTAAVRKKWIKVLTHWWNNVLGFYKLDVNAGRFMISQIKGQEKSYSLEASKGLETLMPPTKRISDVSQVQTSDRISGTKVGYIQRVPGRTVMKTTIPANP